MAEMPLTGPPHAPDSPLTCMDTSFKIIPRHMARTSSRKGRPIPVRFLAMLGQDNLGGERT